MTDTQQQAMPELPTGIWSAIEDWALSPGGKPAFMASKIVDERIKSAMRAYAAEAVARALAASAPSREVPGWISIEDRLPEKNVEVLVAFEALDLPSTGQYTGSPRDHDGWCYPSENRGTAADGGDPRVTHWMPLPAAPSPSVAAEETKNA